MAAAARSGDADLLGQALARLAATRPIADTATAGEAPTTDHPRSVGGDC